MTTLAISAFLRLGSSLLAAAPQDAPRLPSPPPHAALFTDGVRAARVGVVDLGGAQRGWVAAPLSSGAGVLREQPPRLLAHVSAFVPDEARVDLLQRASGSFAWITDTHRGGSRMLELIETRQSPLDADPPAGEPPLAARGFTDVVISGGEHPLHLLDLFAPRLIEQDDRLYVIASSYDLSGDDSGEPITWIAPVPAASSKPTPGETLEGTRIALGADARVVRMGDLWCCCVRQLTPAQTIDDSAPVAVYWSRDLATWRFGLPVDVETPLVDYDVAIDAGTVWLAGVAADRPAVRLWRLTAPQSPWEERSLDLALPYPGASLHLLASTWGAPVPKIIVPGPDETLRVVPIELPRGR